MSACGAFGGIEIPANVTAIGQYAFYQCTGLTELILPEALTAVGSYAFYNCRAIKELILPSSLATVDGCAFYGCSSITSLALPASLTTINGNGFGGLAALKNITFEGQPPATIASNAFSGASATVTYIPYASWNGKIQNYGGTLTWMKINGSCGAEAFWRLDDVSTLFIGGTGTLSEAGWGAYAEGVTTVVIGEDLASIGGNVLGTIGSLNQIVLRGALPAMSEDAFAGATATVYYPHGQSGYTEETMLPYGGNIEAWSQYCPNDGSLTALSPAVSERIEPDCVNAGMKAYAVCDLCGEWFADDTLHESVTEEMLVEQALGHDYADPEFVWDEDGSACAVNFVCRRCSDEQHPEVAITSAVIVEPDCLNPGQTEYTAAVTFGDKKHTAMISHSSTAYAADHEGRASWNQTIEMWQPCTGETVVAPNCTEDGYSEGKCIYCTAEISGKYSVVPALGHTEVIDEAVAPTCTESGLTEGKHCDVCGEVLAAQEIVDALGHNEVIDEAVAPTCTESGLTEGKHCDVCGEVLAAQEIVDALGHTEVIDEAVAPTCTESGLTEGKHCDVCGEVLAAQEIVDALGHTEVIDEAVAPTCTETGLTEGKHCDVCGEVLAAQEIVDALGHTEVIDEAVAPTCTESGLTEGKHCDVCGEVLAAQEIVDALGHTEVIDRAVPATHVTTGLTEGSHCSVCDTVIREQEIIPVVEVGAVFTLPAALKLIEDEAFEGGTFACVVIPDGCTRIEARAFANCTKMQFIEIPASVVYIDDTAFAGCSETLVIVTTADSEAESFVENHGMICVIR